MTEVAASRGGKVMGRSGLAVRLRRSVDGAKWLTSRSVVFSSILWIACAATLVSGCAVKLAPDYDKAIFDGLTAVNEETMTLFASVNSGPFSRREEAYNSVTGMLDALQVQVKARATPHPPAIFGSLLQRVDDRKTAAEVMEPPTGAAITTMSRIVARLRTDDQRGRAVNRVDFLKEAFAVQMAQALTYEKALQR